MRRHGTDGAFYGHALEHGEIELRYDAEEGSFSAWYFEHRLPIAPERYSEILRTVVKEAGAEEDAAGKELLSLASRYHGLRRPNRKEAPASKPGIIEIARCLLGLLKSVSLCSPGSRAAMDGRLAGDHFIP